VGKVCDDLTVSSVELLRARANLTVALEAPEISSFVFFSSDGVPVEQLHSDEAELTAPEDPIDRVLGGTKVKAELAATTKALEEVDVATTGLEKAVKGFICTSFFSRAFWRQLLVAEFVVVVDISIGVDVG
jgi:hypothetical protein